jgi:archaemetzincin
MKFVRFLLVLFCLVAGAVADPALPRVAVQPLGPVKKEDLAAVEAGIVALYGVRVEVLPAASMPESAYYPPRKRYKADKLLDAVEKDAAPDFTKIIGLTARDISTSKDEIEDWGIFGLGNLSGRACVVSTFRLRAGKASEEVFHARLVKVVNHELGHTFGLDHCPTAGCLMQGAGGKIATVDGESGKPCPQCAARLPLVK